MISDDAKKANPAAMAQVTEALLRIYLAHASDNCGIVNGESVLCQYHADEARQALEAAGVKLPAFGVREAPAEYITDDDGPDPLRAWYDTSAELEPIPSTRELIPSPSPIEILRAARPSRELVGLLANLSTEHARQGKTDDAVALLILGLCVREVVPHD